MSTFCDTVQAILDSVEDRAHAETLILALAAQALGSTGGRPRKNGSPGKPVRTPSNGLEPLFAAPSRSISGSDPESESESDPDSEQKNTSAASQQPAEPLSLAVMPFPVVGDPTQPTWVLRADLVDELSAAYPALDVRAECNRARLWVEANPARRKTAKGMKRFICGWIANATNKGNFARKGGDAPKPQYRKLG